MKSEKYIAVAPMMHWTDVHCRYFMRLLNPDIRLYTEMVVADALLYGKAEHLLKFHPAEHPVVLQLGGNDPKKMKDAAIMGANQGYDEININVGCPSNRVQSGSFGACLMAHPHLVAECVDSIISSVRVPVTVKTRIGIDDFDHYDFLCNFIETVSITGCDTFIIHARKAILSGLSPKDNRSIPPLNYERVYQLKADYENLRIIINGGINNLKDCQSHLKVLDGIMIGRHAYQQPWFLSEIRGLCNSNSQQTTVSREELILSMFPYIESQLRLGIKLKTITRHMLGLFAYQPGARAWRRHLSMHAHHKDAGIEVLQEAVRKIPKAA